MKKVLLSVLVLLFVSAALPVWSSTAPNILNWVRYTNMAREGANIEAAINSLVPGATITRSTTDSAAELEAQLAGKDVFLISEPQMADYLGEGVSFAPILQAFVNGGGIVAQAEGGWWGVDILGDAGLMNRQWVSTCWSGYGQVLLPDHPMARGLGTWIEMANATEYYTTDPSVDIVACYGSPDHGVVLSKQIGLGWVVGIGYDYYCTNSDADQIIANAMTLGPLSGVPEPASLVTFMIGGISLAGLMRRRTR